MLIQFTKSTDFEDRHYARGDKREFDAKTAEKLIADGLAVDPEKVKAKAPAVETPTADKPAKKAAGK